MAKFFFAFLLFFLTTIPQPIYAQTKSASAALAYNQVEVDYRVESLRAFLEKYSSPLSKYADTFVEEADGNGLDWRLLVAISGVESTFGQQIPYNSFNAWGWGIYGTNAIYFSSWEEAIKVISKGLKENYIKPLGTDNVYSIGRIYAASPTWASRVIYFINKVENESVISEYTKLTLTI